MLATPINMQKHNSGFADRMVTSLGSIVDNPLQLLSQSRAKVGRPRESQLDILSASSYPHALIPGYNSDHASLKRKAPQPNASSPQLYGGIFQHAQSQDSTETSEHEPEPEPARPKKRARRSKKNDPEEEDLNDDSRRQRGRPRLDTHDETAADRRRTQIRLAQRAYRHRKETTISALKQQVNELQSTIEQMNKTFLDLHDNLIEAGITNRDVSVARQLQKATQDFVSLARISESDVDEEAEHIAKLNDNDNGSSNVGEVMSARPTTTRLSTQHESASDAEIEELPLVNNHFPYMDGNSWPEVNTDILSFRADVPQPQLSLETFSENAKSAAAKLFPLSTLEIEHPLSSPHGNSGSYTYSFQETNFARRLHRRSLETGWRNLTNPSIDPTILNRNFRFTFCFSNRKRMIYRFKDILQRKAGEALENWNVPFFNIGGAGMHFPRRDADGNPIYPPNMLSAEKALVSQDMGPHRWVGIAPETPRPDISNTQAMLEAIGFGGEWFDSRDVEEYLKTKGIFLDGHSSFVEIDSSLIIPKAPTRSHSNSSMSSTPTLHTIRTPSPVQPLYQEFPVQTSDLFTQQELNEMYPSSIVVNAGPNFNFSEKEYAEFPARQQEPMSAEQIYNHQIWPWNADGAWIGNEGMGDLFPQLSQSPNHSTGVGSDYMTQTTPVTLDVEQFLERIVQGSVCLGRAPGFRKDLVENALALSVSEGY